MHLGAQEFLVILLIVLLLFGGKKIPELMRGVGKGMGELQKGVEEGKKSFKANIEEDEKRAEEERQAEARKNLTVETPAATVSRQDDPAKPSP